MQLKTFLLSTILVMNHGVGSPGLQKATFFCRIDGEIFSGTKSSSYANIAIVSAPNVINFVLVPMDGNAKDIPPQLNFFVAPSGMTTVKHNSGKYTVTYSSGGIVYEAVGFIVEVNSLAAGRVSGTFSGALRGPEKTIHITEGTFDIPVSH